MLFHKPQGIIFDMDGLILDTEIIYRQSWQQAATELGYSLSNDLYESFLGRRTADCKALLVETYGSEFPISVFWARGVQLYQEHAHSHGIPTKPGLYELLDFLNACSIRKAVATSSGRKTALLALGDLASHFEAIVTGDEVTQGKPSPDIFLLAAERLEIASENCLVLEDAETGVQAAHAAGMPVIVIPDLKQPSAEILAQAAGICSSLHDVKKLLMNL